MAKAEKSKLESENLTLVNEPERLRLFTKMLRTNALLKKNIIHHK